MRMVLYRTCLRLARAPAGSAADASSTLGGAVPSLGDLLPGILPGRHASLILPGRHASGSDPGQLTRGS